MEEYGELMMRCVAMVAVLDAELGWQLDVENQHTYAHRLAALLPAHCSDMQLRTAIMCYHRDHGLVAALTDRLHAGHDDSWRLWMEQVMLILRHTGLSWSSDAALDIEDLAQIARAELARALPNYRYGSRFSTWAYQVIANSVRVALRAAQAQKRDGQPIQLDETVVQQVTLEPSHQPEVIAHGHVLAAQIDAILVGQPDARLAEIFRLWAYNDLRIEEIGKRVQLSDSQVRVLLKRIRAILQSNPSVSAWRERAINRLAEDDATSA